MVQKFQKKILKFDKINNELFSKTQKALRK